MAAPASIVIIIQPTANSCVPACLAMLLNLPYTEVAACVRDHITDGMSKGLTVPETIRTARHLGSVLLSVPVKEFDHDSTGILFVHRKGEREYHAVLLFQGIIVNPSDGTLTDYSTYMKSDKAKPKRFLVV